jgi:hypothetical protein
MKVEIKEIKIEPKNIFHKGNLLQSKNIYGCVVLVTNAQIGNDYTTEFSCVVLTYPGEPNNVGMVINAKKTDFKEFTNQLILQND